MSDSDDGGVLGWLFHIISQLSAGIWLSLALFALTLIFSMPLGLLICFARRSRFKVVELVAKFYISIMRGTPLMLQLLVVYFGPYYVFKIPLSADYRFYAAIIGFALNYAAYFAEIY
ncbi:MAG: ABC transporter permease subunit, partial [Ruminococcus sp.]|nr:ABC transporter permease subunit [Ruminococcus sp.]